MGERIGVCNYCRETKPLTREHAFPGWVYRRLGIEGIPAELLINGLPAGEPDLAGVAIYALCRECNGSWSVPEQKISKWLGESMRDWSRPFELGPGQRQLVAAWAVKTALMIELALREQREPSFAPESHFRWLFEHRDKLEPPPGCRVWLFGNDRDPQAPTTSGAMVLSSPTDYPPRAYLSTFTIGFMGFQVFGADVLAEDEHGVHIATEAPPFDPDRQAADFLTRIWPDAPVFRWPPHERVAFQEIPWLTYWPRSVYGLTHPPDPRYARTDAAIGVDRGPGR
jgi:hypothetical protein